MEDFEITAETGPQYHEEVVTREYAVALGLPEGVADLLNYTNELANVTGKARPEIQEIKNAVRIGDTDRVKALLEEVETALG